MKFFLDTKIRTHLEVGTFEEANTQDDDEDSEI